MKIWTNICLTVIAVAALLLVASLGCYIVCPCSIPCMIVGLVVSVVDWVFANALVAATLIITILAWLAAVSINRSIHYRDLRFRYWNNDMAEDMRELAALAEIWKIHPFCNEARRDVDTNNGFKVIVEECTRTQNPVPWTAVQDAARRRIKGYFNDALDERKNNNISEDQFVQICKVPALRFFFDVVEPMEAYINYDYNTKPFRDLMVRFGEYVHQQRNETNWERRQFDPPTLGQTDFTFIRVRK